jgi:purine-nucleoside phosphorylase
VYFYMPGPQFESPAEIRAIRALGGDLVGMSCVHEVVMARRCGMDVLGIALVSNMAAGMLSQPITEEEVLEEGEKAASNIFKLAAAFAERI